MVWLPIAAYLFLRSAQQFTKPLPPVSLDNFVSTLPTLSALSEVSSRAWELSFVCFGIGNLIWTLFEYGFHRFLFHVDRVLPDHPAFLTLHFLMHGIHHYLPMDRLRLVMPPPLFFFLSFPMTRLGYLLFPVSIANGIIAGAFTFCELISLIILSYLPWIDVLYDCMHYALHHTKLPQYMKEMKKYHLAHHYKNFDLGFGVTCEYTPSHSGCI
jgi:4-hydroxysphinganine ceramide fatty acyl 2-hydroxylase